LNILRINCVL